MKNPLYKNEKIYYIWGSGAEIFFVTIFIKILLKIFP